MDACCGRGGGGDGKVRAMAEEADPEPGTLATNSLSLSKLATGREERILKERHITKQRMGLLIDACCVYSINYNNWFGAVSIVLITT